MNYGNLLSRSADAVLKNKFLAVLGVLAVLEEPAPLQLSEALPEAVWWLGGLVLSALVLIARGSLIAGVDKIEAKRPVNFGLALSAGRQRFWTLLGIGLAPVIAILPLILITEVFEVFRQALPPLACVMVPVAVLFILLYPLVMRAAVLEDLGVMASYSRGWSVLSGNVYSVVGVFLFQLLLTLLFYGPMLLAGQLLPMVRTILGGLVLLILGGVGMSFFSAMWTIAWREWTGVIDNLECDAAPV